MINDTSTVTSAGNSTVNYAGFWLRVYSGILDVAFFLLLSLPVAYLYSAEDIYSNDSLLAPIGFWDTFFTYILPLLLTIIFWLRFGATPGKLLTSIKIVDDNGAAKLTLRQSLVRYFSSILSVICLGIGLLWVAVDSKKQSWHDVLAKTVVIKKKSFLATVMRILAFPLLLVMLSGFVIVAYQTGTRLLMPTLAESYCQDNVCVDSEEKLEQATALYNDALEFVSTTYLPISNPPKMIFCAQQDCLKNFNEFFGNDSLHAVAFTEHTNGIVIGSDVGAWSQQVVRHEMIHHLQAEHLSVLNYALMPTWYMEGMASSYSGADREKQHPTYVEYRDQFEQWLETIDPNQFWQESRKLISLSNLLEKFNR